MCITDRDADADTHTNTGHWGTAIAMNIKRLFRVGLANGQIVARPSQPTRKWRLRVVMPWAIVAAVLIVEVWRWLNW